MNETVLVGSALLSFINGTIILFVNSHRTINRLFFAASGWIALWFCCVVMAVKTGNQYEPSKNHELIFWLRLSSAVGAFFGWFLWLMKSVLINPSFAYILRRSLPMFLVGCALAGLAFSEWFIPSYSTPLNRIRGLGYYVYAIAMAAMAVPFLVSGIQQYKRLTGVRKVEMQFFVLNSTAACLLLILSNALAHLAGLTWLNRIAPIWFTALHGVTVWAICSHRIFDGKQVLLSLGQRTLLLAGLGCAAVALASLFRQFTVDGFNVLLAGVVACALAIACDQPTRRWLGLDPQYRLMVPRAQIIEWARNIPDEVNLRHRFEDLLRDWCQTDRAFLLSTDHRIHAGQSLALPADLSAIDAVSKGGWLTPESLQRRKPDTGTQECADYLSRNNLGALLAVPKGSPNPSLVIALGQKHSLRPYTYPEIQLLLELAELMDNILTHCRVAANSTRIEKMEAAAMMSRGLAHDLNNLATPVSTFLLHIENRIVEGTSEAAVLADAKHSIKVMQDYIQESLFFARRLVPEFAEITSTDVLSNALRLTQERARRTGVRVTTRIDQHFSFTADRVLIQRLLQNLISNGIDASKQSGSVDVSAIADKAYLRITVADHGTGISADIIDRIFEPYFTTKDTGDEIRGLGLGLAICRKIVDLHRGRIEVNSVPAQGTSFAVILPRSQVPGNEPSLIHAVAESRG